jgi:uncharacterized protein (DUF4415 family)
MLEARADGATGNGMTEDKSGKTELNGNVVPFPEAAPSRVQVTLQLEPHLLEKFRIGEPGWQDRINEVLRARLNDGSKS